MNNIEIIVEVNGVKYYLDTDGIEAIPLTFNIADINDISSTKGSSSKSIVIPETKNNREVFNFISDLNTQSDFNPSLRSRCWIIVDSELLIDGYFQLSRISMGENHNEMTIVVYSDNNNFYNILGEDTIDTIELDEFNHVYGTASIMSSWDANYLNGYYYPLIDYGYDWALMNISATGSTTYNKVEVTQMFPAVYARIIFDKIFSGASFSWSSNSLLEETPFNDMIIPTNSTSNGIQRGSTDPNFKVGMSYSQVVTLSTTHSYTGTPEFDNPPFLNTSSATASERIEFQNEDSPYADDFNVWSQTLFQYTNGLPTYANLRFAFDIKVNQLNYYSTAFRPYFQLWRTGGIFGTLPMKTDEISGEMYAPLGCPVRPGFNGWNVLGTASFGSLSNFETLSKKWYSKPTLIAPGESIYLTYNYNMSGRGGTNSTSGVNQLVLPGTPVAQIDISSFISNEVSAVAKPGDVISLSSCIPKNVKKKDFILSIIKMFNLVVVPDKDRPNHLFIETRDYFYRTGVVKDWTDKVDISDNPEITPLGDILNKKIDFRYKDDSDFYNKDYKSRAGLSYGEFKYDISNQFSDGVKVIEPIFSPTPIVSIAYQQSSIGSTPSSIVIPKIGVNNNGKWVEAVSNIRILLKKKITISTLYSWNFAGMSLDYYPYSGNFDDPFNPTMDINFGPTTGLYYPQNKVTDNNLYRLYWKKQIEEMTDSDSRLVTCSVYLTPADIFSFKFNDNIFIDFGSGGQYYKVTKIEYDPTDLSTSKVEMIRTKDITISEFIQLDNTPLITNNPIISVSNNNQSNVIYSPNAVVNGYNNTVAGQNTIINGNNNTSTGTGNFITGDNNYILSNNTTTIGSGNTSSSSSNNSTIIGNNNVINDNISNNLIIGSGNTLQAPVGATQALTNVTIIGNNITATQSNTSFVGFNYISAGRDSVL